MFGILTVVLSKHITSHRDLFSSLETVPVGNSVMCASNSSYPVKEIGKIQLVAANGSTFVLLEVLFVPGIQKNLLSVFALARNGLLVKFVHDRCTIHDLIDGDNVVASGLVYGGFYRLDAYEKCANEAAGTFLICRLFQMQSYGMQFWASEF